MTEDNNSQPTREQALNIIKLKSGDGRRKIIDEGNDQAPIIREVIAALNAEHEVFSFAGRCTVIRSVQSVVLKAGTDEDADLITRRVPIPANTATILEPFERAIQWHKKMWVEENDEMVEVAVPTRVAGWIKTHLVKMEGDRLTPLNGVADFPVMYGKQLLQGRQGYHPKTGLWIDCDPVDVKQHTWKSSHEAFEWLRDEWFKDFHFKTPQDLIRAICLPITVMKRRTLIQNGAPLWMISAPDPETGKSKLVETLTLAVTNEVPPVLDFSMDSEEIRKAFMAALMESPAVIFFDNLPRGHALNNKNFDMYATSDKYSDRVLGRTETATVAATASIIMTGNNISNQTQDSSSRTILIEMQKPIQAKRPDRDILQWTKDNRAKILSALFAVASANPPKDKRHDFTCRFMSWKSRVADPVLFAAKSDATPFSSWDDKINEGVVFEIIADLCVVIKQWQKAQENAGLSRTLNSDEAKEAARRATNGFSATELLSNKKARLLLEQIQIVSGNNDPLTPHRVPKILKMNLGRIYGKLRLAANPKKNKKGKTVTYYSAETK